MTAVEALPEALQVPFTSPETIEEHSRWQRFGHYALRGGIVALALLTPAARAAMHVAEEPPTIVPQTIAGSEVTTQLNMGGNIIDIEAMGHSYKRPSSMHVGRKTIGVEVVFKTGDLNLTKADHSPDMDKINLVFKAFADPSPEKKEVEDALKHDIYKHAEDGALPPLEIEGILLGLYIARRLQLRGYTPEKRAESIEDRKLLRVVGSGTLLIASLGQMQPLVDLYSSPNHPYSVTADQALAGTALAGGNITGPFKGVIDQLIPAGQAFIQAKNTFYDNEVASFGRQFYGRYHTHTLAKKDGIKRIIWAEDEQGEDGPMRLMGEMAHAYNADAAVLGGDISATGMSWETFVLDAAKKSLGKIPVVVYLGHHDSPAVAKLAAERGFHVVDGKVQVVGGIPFLGQNDPSVIPSIGLPSRLINNDIAPADVAQELENTARESKAAPIIVIHSNEIGTRVAESGSAATVLTGREFKPPFPVNYGSTTEIIAGSAGGHGPSDGLEFYGIISNPAPIYEIELDAKTNQLISYTQVTELPSPSTEVDFAKPVTHDELASMPISGIAASSRKPVTNKVAALTPQSRRQEPVLPHK